MQLLGFREKIYITCMLTFAFLGQENSWSVSHLSIWVVMKQREGFWDMVVQRYFEKPFYLYHTEYQAAAANPSINLHVSKTFKALVFNVRL